MENKYTLEAITADLLEQGLIRKRDQPRRLYHDWPEPEVDVRVLQQQVEELKRLIHSMANAGDEGRAGCALPTTL